MKGVLVLALLIGACGGDPPRRAPVDGPFIYVLFDERHGLEGGEPVRMHGFEIGFVEGVDIAEAGIRAKLVLEADILGQLTTDSTFSVEEEDGLYLEAHVIDPEATALTQGATVDGVDSGWELAYRRAERSASELAEDVQGSDWFKKASELVDEMKRDFDDIDWSEEEKEIRKHWEEAVREIEELTGKSSEKLAERVDEITKELEELGRSDQARKLRERFEKLVEELRERAER
ncbi:MAG: MCE family protein [Acidobacteria bacterium]|nr:MAG: MCE family protein [Acidobacteriota bacterium]